MTETGAGGAEVLYKLAAWLSPAYPVSAYAYSHGLEWAVEAGSVTDAASLTAWIADALEHGSGRTDAILLSHAWRAASDPQALSEVAELAEALAASRERLLETRSQGSAFADTTTRVWGQAVSTAPYPVAVGQAAALHGVAAYPAILLFLQGFVALQAGAALRLIPLGQTAGQAVLADLMPLCAALAAEAERAPIDAVGGAAYTLDIAAMRHETQTVRIFRT